MSAPLAIIGGTGLTSIPGLQIERREMVKTPYGPPSGPLSHGELNGRKIVFLARHGHRHSIPPHKINYRANIWALKSLGVTHIVAVAAVGGIDDACSPLAIVIPDQIIDYTYSREHTFFEGRPGKVEHIDFTYPYSPFLRECQITSAEKTALRFVSTGTYGVVQGPRLETAAEVQRMKRDGCTIVGRTGMPEAALAREVGLEYASCALVVNWAAGITGETEINLSDLENAVNAGIKNVRVLLAQLLAHAYPV